MRNVAAGLQAAATDIERLLQQLRTSTDQLSWTGPDADSYRMTMMSMCFIYRLLLAGRFEAESAQLRQQADAQDAVSATLDGGLSGLLGGLPDFDPSKLRLPDIIDMNNPGDEGPHLRFPDGTPFDRYWGGSDFLDGIKGLPDDRKDLYLELWQQEHEARLAEWGTDGATNIGGLALAGGASLALMSASAGGSAGLTFGQHGVGAYAKGQAGAYLVDAKASGSIGAGPVSATGEARAYVGAEVSGEGKLAIGPDGVTASAGVDAFAGAKASAEASVDVGGVGGSGTAAAGAGIGAKADADVQISADQVHVGVSLGAAVGIGGSLEFEIDIKPKEIMHNAGKLASKLNPFD
ncbi:MAG: hypothetical protein ABMA25_07865 [Ilumatobacteraceae bacterium]